MRCESLVSDVFSMFLLGQMFVVLRRVCVNSLIFTLSCLQWKCIINDCITHWGWLLYYKWWWFILWDSVTTESGGQASTWQAFPSVPRSNCAAWISTGHLSVHTNQSDPVLRFRDQGSTSVASRGLCRAPAFSFHPWWQVKVFAWLSGSRMRLYICVCGRWKWCDMCVCVCVGQMACGSNPKWNRTSFVGDIMTYLVWFLDGCCCCHYVPLTCAKWNLFAG